MQIRKAREQYLRWLVVTRDLSPHTIRAYEGDLTAFERYLGNQTLVDRIDRECLISFMERQQSEGSSARSIRRRVSGVRGFCKWLQSQHLIDSDPSAGISVAAGRSRMLPRTVPTHELNCLFLYLQKKARLGDLRDSHIALTQPDESTTLLAVALILATGARVNEIVSIKCDDLDLPNRSLRIVGKGRRERQVFLTNDWITDLTRAYLNTRIVLDFGHVHLLFDSNRRALTAPALRTRLVKAAQNAGLSTRVTPHMLRHTAATQLIEAGVDIRYIQRLLGHSSLATTEIYTHVSDRALNRVISEADVLGRCYSRDN
jgi:site-specific recombinase XerD